MIPLEKQCVSLELAKRLKELGVKQLDNSLWAWAQVAKKEKDALGRPLWSYEVVANNFQADIEFIAAFTVAELGEMLPKGIRTWKIDDDLWTGDYGGAMGFVRSVINPPVADTKPTPTPRC